VAEARVPMAAGQRTRGSATVERLDTARLSAAIPGGGLRLTGTAGGRVDFAIPPDVSKVEADVRLSAPDLTVQGVPAEHVQAAVRAHKGALTYDVSAESLGGKVKFQGDFPLNAPPARAAANGELRAAGFTLAGLWKALGVTGAAAHLEGQGAVDANLRAARTATGEGLWAHGIVEVRDLNWGSHYPLGHLRGIVAMSPTVWRIEPLGGELLGGPARGFVWGTTPATGPRQLGFDLRVDRAALKHALAFLPFLARQANGYGTLMLAGNLDEAFRANAELTVARARFAGLPLSELRAPAELVLTPITGTGVLHVRRWTARFAGGQLRGDASLRVGPDRSFSSDLQLADVDLEAFSRLESEARRPASGKVSGRVTLAGPDPAQPRQYRGRVVLDLDDASLVNIPVFRELDKFLGAARGGLFEDGDLTGTIANRQLVIDALTLQGRLAQVHATGTVGFDGQLNLEVLVNTNQIIPETGQALAARIPGLSAAFGRNEEAALRVSNYLSNRLLKLRVTGTLKNPSVTTDTSVVVADTALAFFADVLKLPLGFLK
jgi:translocation and assembly module TamB